MLRRAAATTTLALVSLAAAQQCSVPAADRVDCFPQGFTTDPAPCQARGCCYQPSTAAAGMGVPWCFYPSDFGYTLGNVQDTPLGFTGVLSLANPSRSGPYGRDIATLRLDVQLETADRLHFRITDPNNARYEVPITTAQPPSQKPPSTNYRVDVSHAPFGLAVVRRSDGVAVFNSTAFGGLLFEDQFLQLSSRLPSANLYGLGEHVAPFRLSTAWSQSPAFSLDQGTPTGVEHNLYGVHPFYVNVEPSGRANGVFLLNSNAMETLLQPTPAITWRTIGGVLDYYVFLGPSVDQVVAQYTEVIGRPYLPPYWSLGFHLCRWGYGSSNRTWDVVRAMRAAGIPQDTQWNDIDYMRDHLDFTFDPQSFASLPALVDDLHANGQHYIMITDPGISNAQPAGQYAPYDDGLRQGVFMKHQDGSVLIGKVWPGTTAFPDFFHPDAEKYWQDAISTFHSQVAFDGLWIDMNEPSNFVDGSTVGCPASPLETPPYQPHVDGQFLRTKTVCMTARHANGGGNATHYDQHSLYGWSEARATMRALTAVLGRRTVVISRSTYPSSGVYGGHWLGDNTATWNDLYLSIPGLLSFQLFGIPLVGADICGFNGDTTEELCTRWMQLGAFYPFSRNHNTIGARDQDPTAFGPQLANSSRSALLARYRMLPYLYTLFYDASVTGTPVARAQFYDFPTDAQALGNDKQFLWGRCLLVSPVLTAGATQLQAYFPADRWYDYYTLRALDSTGQTVTLDAPLSKINLHLRAGCVVPMQEPALTTAASRKNPFALVVTLSATGGASGEMYLDDGDSLTGSSTLLQFNATSTTLVATAVRTGYTPAASLGGITVAGLAKAPGRVTVAGQPVTTFTYDAAAQLLTITSLAVRLTASFTATYG